MLVYGDSKSGNCYKIKLTFELLSIPYEWRHIDILAGDTKTPEYLAKNPAGKIPLLELNDGRVLRESNAIINFIAHDSALLPNEPFANAQVQQWQFFEQYSHEPYIAVARFINKYLGLPDARKDEYKKLQAGGHKALTLMESQLSSSDYLVGGKITTADISLYAYTHVSEEGGFDLGSYPNIRAWMKRIEAQPSYAPML